MRFVDSGNLEGKFSPSPYRFEIILIDYERKKLTKSPQVESNSSSLHADLYLREIANTRFSYALCDVWPDDRCARTFSSTFRRDKVSRPSGIDDALPIRRID